MGALRHQPQVKAAIARTQTESSVLELLENFATYETEVTAIDELRKVGIIHMHITVSSSCLYLSSYDVPPQLLIESLTRAACTPGSTEAHQCTLGTS